VFPLLPESLAVESTVGKRKKGGGRRATANSEQTTAKARNGKEGRGVEMFSVL